MKNYIGSLYSKENMKYIELLPEIESSDIIDPSGKNIHDQIANILDISEDYASEDNLIKIDDNVNNEFDIPSLFKYDISKKLKYILAKKDNTLIRIIPKTWNIGVSPSIPSYGHNSVGSATAALTFNGVNPLTSIYNDMQSFNGTAWSTKIGSNNKVKFASSSGLLNDALSIGGFDLEVKSIVQKYNDNTWSNMPNLPIAVNMHSSSGLSTDTIVASGATASSVIGSTMLYNGENWYMGPDISIPRHSASINGVSTSAILHGGMDIRTIDTTEIFNGQIWSTLSGNMNTARYALASTGDSTSVISSGGDIGSSVSNLTEKFNGETWDVLSSINMKRKYFSASGNNNTTLLILGDVFDTCSTEVFTDQNIPILKHIGTSAINANELLQLISNNVPYTKVWSKYMDLSFESSGSCGVDKDDEIYIIGGIGNDDRIVAVIRNKVDSMVASMNIARQDVTAAESDNLIYSISDYGDNGKSSYEIYNNEVWSLAGTIPVIPEQSSAVGGTSVLLLYTTLYANSTKTIEYNETWKSTSDLNSYLDWILASGKTKDALATTRNFIYNSRINPLNIVENRRNDLWYIHSNSNILHIDGSMTGASHGAILAKSSSRGDITEELIDNTWHITHHEYISDIPVRESAGSSASSGDANHMITFGGGNPTVQNTSDHLQDVNTDIFGTLVSSNEIYTI